MPGGKLLLRPGKNSLHRSRQSWPRRRWILRKEKRACSTTATKNFVNAKEKMYDHFPLTVHQMDIIIGVLFALIALFLVLGVTHTSFFGLFGG